MDGTWPVITIAPVENDDGDDYTSWPDNKNSYMSGLTPESNPIPVQSICETQHVVKIENLKDDGSPTFKSFADASSDAKESISRLVLGVKNRNDSHSISASSSCETQPLVKTENVDKNELNSVASSSICETQPFVKIENVEDTSSFDFKFCTAVSDEVTDGDNDVFGQDYSEEHDRSSSTSVGSAEDSEFMIKEPEIKKMKYNKSKTNRWKCLICEDRFFPSHDDLIIHQKIVHAEGTARQRDRIKEYTQRCIQNKIYKCIDCYKEFLNLKDYQHHIHNHIRYDIVTEQLHHGCKICGKKVSNEDALFDHLETAHNQSTERRCSLCPKTFRGSKQFNVHVSYHLLPDIKLDRLRACEVCLKICNSSSKLREHNMQMHAQKFFICRVCDTNFEDNEALKKHIQQFGDEENHNKIRNCQFCGLYNEPSHRISHLTKLAAGKLYVCPICDGILPDMFTMKDLEAHIKTHGIDSDLMCWQCRVICDSVEQLRSHKKTHKYKMYRCEICSDVFQLLSSYMKHVRGHETRTPFQCHIKECRAYFPTRSLLVKHCELHYKFGDHAYSCRECGLRMNSLDSYNSHIYNHLGIQNYYCKLCKMVFIEKRSYDQHSCDEGLQKSTIKPATGCKFDNSCHTCAKCKKVFLSTRAFLGHKRSCKVGIYCSLCKLTFSSKSAYDIHLRTCGKQKQRKDNRLNFQGVKIPCTICGQEFNYTMMALHQKQCHNIDFVSEKSKVKALAEGSHKSGHGIFTKITPAHELPGALQKEAPEDKLVYTYHTCANCQEPFVSTREYLVHRRACKPDATCQWCKRMFPSVTSFNIHLRTCGKQKEISGYCCRKWCTICGLKLESLTFLKKHYKEVHSMDRNTLSEHLKPDAYKSGRTWGEYNKIEVSQETLNAEACSSGSNYCGMCKLTFASTSSYNNHLKTCRKTMDPETESTWCTVCGQTLESAALLEMHRRIVHNENKAAGIHEDNLVVKQKNLQDYVNPKLNEEPFLCPVEKCSVTFDSEMKMKYHLVKSHQAVPVESSKDKTKIEQAETEKLHEIDFETQKTDIEDIVINSAVSKPRIQNVGLEKVFRGVKEKSKRKKTEKQVPVQQNKTEKQIPVRTWKTCGKCGKSYKFVHGCEPGNY